MAVKRILKINNLWPDLFNFYNSLTLAQTSPGFTRLQYKSFENTVGKEEIACNEQFLLFPQFSTHS